MKPTNSKKKKIPLAEISNYQRYFWASFNKGEQKKKSSSVNRSENVLKQSIHCSSIAADKTKSSAKNREV